jgi:hypothetical protein
LIAVLVTGLLGSIVVAYRASDVMERQQHDLLTWRYESARIDSLAVTMTGSLFQWNNALLANDPEGTAYQLAGAVTNIAAIEALVAQVSARRTSGRPTTKRWLR